MGDLTAVTNFVMDIDFRCDELGGRVLKGYIHFPSLPIDPATYTFGGTASSGDAGVTVKGTLLAPESATGTADFSVVYHNVFVGKDFYPVLHCHGDANWNAQHAPS